MYTDCGDTVSTYVYTIGYSNERFVESMRATTDRSYVPYLLNSMGNVTEAERQCLLSLLDQSDALLAFMQRKAPGGPWMLSDKDSRGLWFSVTPLLEAKVDA